MKFIHTADLHLNALRTRFPGEYLIRHKYTLQKIKALSIKYNVDAIVISGDIWDRPDLTNQERILFTSWLKSCNIPVLIISGNHDQRISGNFGDTAISYLAKLSPIGMHVVCDSLPTFTVIKDTNFLLLPYHGWTTEDLRIVVQSMVDKIKKDNSFPIVVAMHEAVSGAVIDNGNTIISKSVKVPNIDDVIYWALGDIHKRQKISDSIFYCGAPHQVNFGERADNKGVLIVDTDKPNKPMVLNIEHPFPLIVWDNYSPDKDIPVFLKVKPTEELSSDIVLPENVIYEPPQKQHNTYEINTEDPLAHLSDYLYNEGISPELVTSTEHIARSMLSELINDISK